MRSLLVELDRYRARRAVALMLVGVTLLVAWVTFQTIWESRPVSSTEIAAAKEAASREDQAARKDYETCLSDPEVYFASKTASADDCRTSTADYRNYLPRQQLSLEEELGDTGKAAILLMAGIGIIAGATFAGADWASGSMGNQLLFRFRRLRLWTAKAAAVTVGATLAAALVLTAQWGSYFAAAELGSVSYPSAFSGALTQTLARGLALVAGGALGAFALTMLTRSTVGTLAVLFFYSVGGQALVAALPSERTSQWSLSSNVFAWLDDGTRLRDEDIRCVAGPGADCGQYYTLSLAHGATYLGVLLVLVVVVSAWLFHRRDVP